MEQTLADLKRTNDPKLAEFEAILTRKKRDLLDLKNRKRNEDDQERRAVEQKKKDERRTRPS